MIKYLNIYFKIYFWLSILFTADYLGSSLNLVIFSINKANSIKLRFPKSNNLLVVLFNQALGIREIFLTDSDSLFYKY